MNGRVASVRQPVSGKNPFRLADRNRLQQSVATAGLTTKKRRRVIRFEALFRRPDHVGITLL